MATAPTFCVPMQPRQVAELPTGPDWLYEIKWDGFRCLAIKHGDAVRFVSRNEKELTKQFPAVTDALSRIKAKDARGAQLGP